MIVCCFGDREYGWTVGGSECLSSSAQCHRSREPKPLSWIVADTATHQWNSSANVLGGPLYHQLRGTSEGMAEPVPI